MVRELQVRLAHLDLFDATVTGYFGNVTKGAVTAYQTSKGQEATGEVYPDLWALLQSETPTPTEEELYPPPPEVDPPTVDPGSLDARCLTGRALCVDKTDRALRWVVNGRVVMEMDARFGGSGFETREGQFSVFWKDRDHVSSLYESAMPFSMFFSGGQAVHYSADFAAVGLRRRVPRLREHPRLRRPRVAVRPGERRRQGDRLLELTEAGWATVTSARSAPARRSAHLLDGRPDVDDVDDRRDGAGDRRERGRRPPDQREHDRQRQDEHPAGLGELAAALNAAARRAVASTNPNAGGPMVATNSTNSSATHPVEVLTGGA